MAANVFVESKEALARLTQSALEGLRDGLQSFQGATGLPVGLAIDPQTGHASIELSFVLLDGPTGINAAFEQQVQGTQFDEARKVQGDQVDSTTENKGTETENSSTVYGPTTSEQRDSGIDRQHEDREYGSPD